MRENDYDNCLYACRFCNRSRAASPERRGGVRLLDPTRDAWSEHFSQSGDSLQPVPSDAEAEYTHRTYELNDPRKVERRQVRRELLADRLRLLTRLESDCSELLRLAGFLRRRDPQRFSQILQQIQTLRGDAHRALRDLYRYAAIPADAPRICRCRATGNDSLPEELDRQTVEVPDTF